MKSRSERRGRWRRASREIQLIPFMDVLLVLLVCFMVGAPIAVQGIDLRLPATRGADLGALDAGAPLIISIDQGGVWHMQLPGRGGAFEGADALQVGQAGQLPHRDSQRRARMMAHLGLLRERDPDMQVLVRGHALAPYEAVARLLAELQLLGLQNVSLVTVPAAA